MATINLPFEFPPNGVPSTEQIQANFVALRDFIQDVNDAVETFTNLSVSSSLTVGASGTKTLSVSDSSGTVAQGKQPAFLALQPAVLGNNQTGDTDPHAFLEVYDVANNYASNVFTAPVTGKYFFSFAVNLGPRAGTPATNFTVKLVTTGRTYSTYLDAPTNQATPSLSVIADMTAGDTAKVVVDVSLVGTTWSSEVSAPSFFSGTLLN